MKSIYLLLTRSDTYVSKTIGLATSDKYTHISISFEETLANFYGTSMVADVFVLTFNIPGLIISIVGSG